MADIVEQLRDLQSGAQWACGATAATLGEAADEIERLRAEKREYAAHGLADLMKSEMLLIENDQLRAKLEAVEMELARAVVQITGLEYRGG